jgi:exosortase
MLVSGKYMKALSGAPYPTRAWLYLLSWLVFLSACFLPQIFRFVTYSLSNDTASELIVVPFLGAWLLYLQRSYMARKIRFDATAGIAFVAAGLALLAWTIVRGSDWSGVNRLGAFVLCFLLLWFAGFCAFLGRSAFYAALFPNLFLLLMVPLPETVLRRMTYFLQEGSTDVATWLFDLVGVPVWREGFILHLPRLSIEVAEQCSGIRSTSALLILALLVCHLYLRRFWRQAVFMVICAFVAVLKNAIRIVTLTLLASYVDPSFLFGRLHRNGGVVFFLLGMVLLLPCFWFLYRTENKQANPSLNPID